MCRVGLIAAMALTVAGPACADNHGSNVSQSNQSQLADLSDGDLTALASSSYDKLTKQNTRVNIGRYHGAIVVADFPCSDLCPQETTRVIHFDVSVGVECDKAGGKSIAYAVPRGIGMSVQTFCVPAILVPRN